MYKIKIDEKEFTVEPDKSGSNKGLINGIEYDLDILREKEGFHIIKNHKSYNVSVVEANYGEKKFILKVNGKEVTATVADKFDLLLKEMGLENLASSKVNDLKAPMPGLVLKINVDAGTEVKKGDPLIVLEAMKMENVLKAEADAVVKDVSVEIGKAVEKNQILIAFET